MIASYESVRESEGLMSLEAAYLLEGSAAWNDRGLRSVQTQAFHSMQWPLGPHMSPVSRRQQAHAVLRASIAALWRSPLQSCGHASSNTSFLPEVDPAWPFTVQHLLQAEGSQRRVGGLRCPLSRSPT